MLKAQGKGPLVFLLCEQKGLKVRKELHFVSSQHADFHFPYEKYAVFYIYFSVQ